MIFRPKYPLLAMIPGLLIVGGIVVFAMQNREGNDEWREVREHVLPQFMPATNTDRFNFVHDEFSTDVSIGYVVDHETTYDFIGPEMAAAWGVDEQTVKDQAIENLEERAKNLEMDVAFAGDVQTPQNTYIAVETADGYSAVLLLSARVRGAVKEELGAEYIAAIPHRDFLIFWHPDFPLTDAFLKQVALEYQSEDTYMLTPQPFGVTDNGIQPLEGNPHAGMEN